VSHADRLIAGVTLIDGTGRPPRAATDVLIRAGRITDVGDLGRPIDADVIDGRGRWLIPGLWDTHSHVAFPAGGLTDPREHDPERAEEALRAHLRNGVTTVADMGGSRAVLLALRQRQRRGEITGARLLVTGGTFTAPGGHPAVTFFGGDRLGDATRQVDDPELARAAVRELAQRDRVDAVKIVYSRGHGAWSPLPRLRLEILRAVLDETHELGLRAIVHCDEAEEAIAVLELGIDGLEHMFHPRTGSLAEDGQALIERALEHGTTWSPTLVHFESLAHAGDLDYLERYHAAGTVPEFVRASLVGSGSFWMTLDEDTRARHRECLEAGLEIVAAAREAGVSLAVGCDSGASGVFHGLSVHREMALLREAGVAPLEVVRAATSAAAAKFGLEAEFGSVEPGKVADLVLLAADPLTDPLTVDVEMVFLDGEPHRPDELRVT
jgi:imidazolonepropionase-like amidohydrolase